MRRIGKAIRMASIPLALSAIGMSFGLPPSEIRVGAFQRPNGIEPGLWDHLPSRPAIGWSHDTAFEFAYLEAEPKLVPLIASEPLAWDASRTKAVLKIRSGIRARNSKKALSASDFADAWNKLAELPPQSVARRLFRDNIAALNPLDELRLEITLRSPDPDLTAKLTLGFTAPRIETGPWTLEEWSTGRGAAFEATRGYSNSFYPIEGSDEFKRRGLVASPGDAGGLALPRADRLSQVWVESPASGLAQFLASRIDILPLSPEILDKALLTSSSGTLKPELAARGIRLEQGFAPEWTLALLNLRTLKDSRVRRRIVASLDPKFWKAAMQADDASLGSYELPLLEDWGVAREARKSLPPGAPSKNADSPMTLHVDWSTLEPTTIVPPTALRTLASTLEEAGFSADTETLPLKAAIDRFKAGKTDVLILAWRWNYPGALELVAPILELEPSESPETSLIKKAASEAKLPGLSGLAQALERTALWSAGPRQRRSVLLQPWVFGYRVDSRNLNPEKYVRIDRELRRNLERDSQGRAGSPPKPASH